MIYSDSVIVTRLAPGDDAQAGMFDGYASTFSRDRHGDQLAPGAFVDSISALEAGRTRIPLLLNHDTSTQLGGVRKAAETPDGLHIAGQIVTGTPAADRAVALARAGQLSLSVGFMPIPGQTEPIAGGGTLYKRVDLVEVSAVATPSNRESRVLSIKTLACNSPAELEKLLHHHGLPPMKRRLARKVARACLAAINKSDSDHPTAEMAEVHAALARLAITLKQGN